MQKIIDPRKFTEVYPESNIVINQALQVVNSKLDKTVLDQTIRNILKNENDALVNVALNLSPNQKTAITIWDSLNSAINLNDDDSKNSLACFFAIPVILVAGSKNLTSLKTEVDVDTLNNFFIKNKIINSGQDFYISGKLLEPQIIAKIKPSQLYYWIRNSSNAKLWLPTEIKHNNLEVMNEGVFLRFLVGVVRGDNDSLLHDVIDSKNFQDSSIELMRFIVNELKTDGVTMFPIPFAPVNLSLAYNVGDNYRKEIAIQVALSNAIRKIREVGQRPIVELDCVDGAVRLKVINQETQLTLETSLWHLTVFDDLNIISDKLTDLLQEMNVEYRFN